MSKADLAKRNRKRSKDFKNFKDRPYGKLGELKRRLRNWWHGRGGSRKRGVKNFYNDVRQFLDDNGFRNSPYSAKNLDPDIRWLARTLGGIAGVAWASQYGHHFSNLNAFAKFSAEYAIIGVQVFPVLTDWLNDAIGQKLDKRYQQKLLKNFVEGLKEGGKCGLDPSELKKNPSLGQNMGRALDLIESAGLTHELNAFYTKVQEDMEAHLKPSTGQQLSTKVRKMEVIPPPSSPTINPLKIQ